MQGHKRFAGVDMQQTSDGEFCHQIFRMLKMDASVSVDSRVLMQKRALRKYVAGSGFTEVVKPDGRQYTLKHGKALVGAIAAGIEPLESRRKVGREMQFYPFKINDKQQRNKAVIEANDAVHRQTPKRRDAKSVAAAGTTRRKMLLVSTTHTRVPRPLVREQRETVGTTATSVSCVVSKVISSGTVPKDSRVRQGMAFMATARTQTSNSSPQAVPLSIHGARPPRCPLRLPPLERKGTRPPQKRWFRRPSLLSLKRLPRTTMATRIFSCRGRRW